MPKGFIGKFCYLFFTSDASEYAWFFRTVPPSVPIEDCDSRDDLTLLYVGISSKNAKSRQNLRKRISCHYLGNAGGSTLSLPRKGWIDRVLRRISSLANVTQFQHLN